MLVIKTEKGNKDKDVNYCVLVKVYFFIHCHKFSYICVALYLQFSELLIIPFISELIKKV